MRTRRISQTTLVRAAVLLFVVWGLSNSPVRAEEQPAFEAPTTVKASEVLDSTLLKGAHYTVRDDVRQWRFLNVYDVDSQLGVYYIRSKRLLEIRLHEIEVMSRVVGVEGGSQFLKALGHSLAGLPTAAVAFVLHPIHSAKKVGKGLAKTGGRIYDLFRSRPRSAYENSKVSTAFSGDEKRELAAHLKLDVYSTNPQVQRFLSEIGSARALGNLGVDVASLALPIVGFLAVSAAKWRADVERLLRDKTPTELDLHNARVLSELGVPDPTWRAFLRRPWLSPRHRTVITAALKEMEGTAGLAAVIEAASTTKSETSALYHTQQAMLLSHFHTDVSKLTSLRRVEHVVLGRTHAGEDVAFLPADRIYWMQDFSRLVDSLRANVEGAPVVPLRLFVTGIVTPRTKRELEQRGISIVTNYTGADKPDPEAPFPDPAPAEARVEK